MASLSRVDEVVTKTILPLCIEEIRQKAKEFQPNITSCNSLGTYSGIKHMARDASVDAVKLQAVVQGALDDQKGAEMKVVAIVSGLLDDDDASRQLGDAESKLGTLAVVLAYLASRGSLHLITQIDKCADPSYQLMRLKERRLDELAVRCKESIGVSQADVIAIEALIAYREQLQAENTVPFRWQ